MAAPALAPDDAAAVHAHTPHGNDRAATTREWSRTIVRLPSRLAGGALWLLLGVLLLVPTLCFLVLAVSPRLFEQGTEWFTLRNFGVALQGQTLQGLLNTLVVGVATAVCALVIGLGLAWLTQRTDFGLQGVWTILIWALLLMPSYFSTLGWQSLLVRNGVFSQIGIDPTELRDQFFGPIGIVWILTTKGIPFAYLAIAAGLGGLGREFEDAARVHGATPRESLRIAMTILSPALWSALAIVFAEAISDFGVASTLGYGARFPLATFTLYRAINSIPIRFPVASVIGWFLVSAMIVALLVQNRALKGRSFAVLSGRTRPAMPTPLTGRGRAAAWAAMLVFFGLALGVPLFGAVSASFLLGIGGTITRSGLTLDNYRAALTSRDLLAPMLLSAKVAAITATVAVVLGVTIGRIIAQRRAGAVGRALDLALLGAVALPGVVLAAGYIFAYNLPIFRVIGFSLYGTVFLLGMAYVASSLPATTRLLLGPLAQMQRSLTEAARVHGASEAEAVRSTLLPLMARSILWAWLLAFTHITLELPISEILNPPGEPPLAVGIIRHLDHTDYTTGAAMLAVAVGALLVVIGVVLGVYRLVVPAGWQRVRAR